MKTLKDIISTLDVQQVQGNQNVSKIGRAHV